MTARLVRWLAGLGAAGLEPVALGATQPPTPTIVWEAGTGGTVAALVRGLPPGTADALRSVPEADPRRDATLAVCVADVDGSVPPDRPAIVGRYRLVAGPALRFIPRFPLEAPRRYRATFDPDGAPGGLPELVANRPVAAAPRPRPPRSSPGSSRSATASPRTSSSSTSTSWRRWAGARRPSA